MHCTTLVYARSFSLTTHLTYTPNTSTRASCCQPPLLKHPYTTPPPTLCYILAGSSFGILLLHAVSDSTPLSLLPTYILPVIIPTSLLITCAYPLSHRHITHRNVVCLHLLRHCTFIPRFLITTSYIPMSPLDILSLSAA